MKIEVNELQASVHRGARVAYNLDNPSVAFTPFEDWLGRSVSITKATGRSEIVSHLTELCARAVEGRSRVPLNSRSEEDQQAVQVAHATLQGLSELEEMARLAAGCEVS